MTQASDVSQALAALQARWGAAAPRRWGDAAPVVHGALAMAPLPVDDEADETAEAEAGPASAIVAPANPFAPATRPGVPASDTDGRVVPTGFAALDAVLGTGGLPRSATVALRGSDGSGRTTIALRVAAEAQAAGSIVAWLDLARAFDPVEAVARGVRPEWLVVLVPEDLDEALGLAGSLLAARTVDLLVLDLPDGRDPAVAGARVGDRLGRLAALARRAGTLLVVLAPDGLSRGLAAAVDEASGLRLELRRSGWIRLGRDVVGQRCRATVARNKYGPPGRDAELSILYAEGGPRDGCLARPDLLTGLERPAAPPGLALASADVAPATSPPAPPGPISIADRKGPHLSIDHHASAVPALAAPAPPPRTGSSRRGRRHLKLLADRPDRSRRTAVDGRDRPGRGSARPGARRPPGDPARIGASPGPRGGLPGPDAPGGPSRG